MSYYKSDKYTQNSGQRGQKIHKQSFLFTETTMDKYAKISYLLGNFMENDGKRRSDTNRNTYEIARSDNQSIYQIMNHISN